MKKLIALSLLIGCISITKAQDAKTVFSANEIVWFGLDFSKAKFVGAFDQGMGLGPATGSDIKNKYALGWNELIAKEQPKFDLRKTFRKDNVIYDLKSINEINKNMNADDIMVYNEGKIEQAEITAMVKKYTPDVKKEGVGLSFIVENFNKNTQMADVYVTFFDIASKKLLFTEKVSGKAMGVGMRNYWAGSIKDILKKIEENEYKNWKTKHG
jgi:hypothetical protein